MTPTEDDNEGEDDEDATGKLELGGSGEAEQRDGSTPPGSAASAATVTETFNPSLMSRYGPVC